MGRNCLPIALSKIDFSLLVILNLVQDLNSATVKS
jgi:hypothetical protein